MILSIIIPTHERPHYIVPTIKSILSISKDIEVVVSDTSQHDNISSHFSEILAENNPRLKIVRPNKKLNVVENFELGLNSSSGNYLVFIGDDDFIHESIIDITHWADLNNVDSIKSTLPAHYNWPDYVHKRNGDYYAGKIFIKKYTSTVKKIDTKLALFNSGKYLGDGVLTMPRAYAGMISKKLANNIVNKYGSLFGGVSPDIYSSSLISIESENCFEIDYPFIIPGTSGGSTAGLSGNGKHIGKLRDNPHIGAFRDLIWNDLIPEFYSVPTVWSYSFVEAINNVRNLTNIINYPRLYVKCLIYHSQYKESIFKSIYCHVKKFGYIKTIFGLARGMITESIWFFKKAFGILSGKIFTSNDLIITGAADTNIARKLITEKLSRTPLILKSI